MGFFSFMNQGRIIGVEGHVGRQLSEVAGEIEATENRALSQSEVAAEKQAIHP
jgi:hypothetical protein